MCPTQRLQLSELWKPLFHSFSPILVQITKLWKHFEIPLRHFHWMIIITSNDKNIVTIIPFQSSTHFPNSLSIGHFQDGVI